MNNISDTCEIVTSPRGAKKKIKAEQVFKQIMAKNFPNTVFKKAIKLQIPKRINSKKSIPRFIMVILLKN